MSVSARREHAAELRRFKAYPAYKDSGVEWLGEIPAHWEVQRLKFLLIEPLKYGANEAAELDDPDLPRYVRITDIDESDGLRRDTFKSLPVDVAEGYLLKEGDLLFARSGATAGKTFLYKRSWGACAYAGYLIRARLDTTRVSPPFVRYFTASSNYWQWLSSAFIQATIQNVSAEKYASLPLPISPYPEQRAIAAFLDRETARIDALAAKKERLIELLQEQRTALITRAVTRGLDPNAPMKDSGVEWLGEIPAHWEVKRLKHVSSVENSGAYGAEPGEGAVDLPVCTTAHLTPDGRFLIEEMPLRGFSVLEAARYVGAPGDIFVVKSSGSNTNIISGKLGLVTEATSNVVFSNFLLRIRPSVKSVFSEFLAYLLRSELTRERIQRMIATTTYPNIDVPEYVGSALALPPVTEQQHISAVLNKETTRIDALIARVRLAIDRLQELRTALISAAITGKIDVRSY